MLKRGVGQDVGEDGISLKLAVYTKDEIYPVGDALGRAFIKDGIAVEIGERKDAGPAPENKMASDRKKTK
jgi:hypothetical protein